MSPGFQRQGFRIPQANVSRIPDSRLPYGANRKEILLL